jgi:L-threonylcarbamoyladenylate synthase
MPRLIVRAGEMTEATLRPAVEWIRAGGIVAGPTDTFYGLAVDPRSASAVAAVFDLKGRGARAALPLVAASIGQVVAFAGPLTPLTRRLAERWWPGPLSLLCDAPATVDAHVHAGEGAVAIRVPAHPIAAALAAAFGAPLTATSANRSGAPPAADVDALGAIADDPRVFVIDAGPAPGGAASTIVDARGDAPRLVRAGAVAWDRVLRSLQA